jgi:hypothetical protein
MKPVDWIHAEIAVMRGRWQDVTIVQDVSMLYQLQANLTCTGLLLITTEIQGGNKEGGIAEQDHAIDNRCIPWCSATYAAF